MKPRQASILVVEDDPSFSDILKTALLDYSRVETAGTLRAAEESLRRHSFDVVLLDLGLPDGDGLSLIPRIRQSEPPAATIIITMSHDVRRAVEAVRKGAEEYVTKDLGLDEILRVIKNTVTRRMQDLELTMLRCEVEGRRKSLMFSDVSPAMRQLSANIKQAASAPPTVTILIEGESGTGKELAAQEIHRAGRNPGAPFAAVNLSAVPRELVESTLFGHEKGSFTGAHQQHTGKFEQAGEGTLFLDEIGCISLEIQTKLLRVIQEREFEKVGGERVIRVRCRLIAATHRDLLREVERGAFREDLYYRLNVYPLHIPAMRERMEQLPYLGKYFFNHYLTEFGKPEVGVAEEVWKILSRYSWPGNVRELENLMQRLAVINRGEEVSAGSLPEEFRCEASAESNSLRDALDRFERHHLLQALAKFQGNQRMAAEYLQIPLSTFKFKLRRFRLSSASAESSEAKVIHLG